MKAIELKMPDEVYKKLENLASQDHQSVNAFALRKLEELARAVEDLKELERRAQRGNRGKFEASMAKVLLTVTSWPPQRIFQRLHTMRFVRSLEKRASESSTSGVRTTSTTS